MNQIPAHLDQPVATIARKDFAKLPSFLSVGEALESIRTQGLGERIIYFYVIDSDEKLIGIVPTRRLLTSPLRTPIVDIMVNTLLTINESISILEAHSFFIKHKLLAFPTVDDDGRITGVVDVTMFTEDDFDQSTMGNPDRLFEVLGFRIMQIREGSLFSAFRFRFPWLIATITSGTFCAILVGVYEVTLAKSLVLAFFLTLVLGLGESVSIQSMTMAIYSLRSKNPDSKWYLSSLAREVGTGAILGLACGAVVGIIAFLLGGELIPAIAIGSSLILTLTISAFFGLSVPTVLHKLKLDMTIAAGPLTLGFTDVSTIVIYFTLASLLI
jgi:magnesium transporter